MEKQREEMKVEFIEELDFSRVPKDIFDAFLDALADGLAEEITSKGGS